MNLSDIRFEKVTEAFEQLLQEHDIEYFDTEQYYRSDGDTVFRFLGRPSNIVLDFVVYNNYSLDRYQWTIKVGCYKNDEHPELKSYVSLVWPDFSQRIGLSCAWRNAENTSVVLNRHDKTLYMKDFERTLGKMWFG